MKAQSKTTEGQLENTVYLEVVGYGEGNIYWYEKYKGTKLKTPKDVYNLAKKVLEQEGFKASTHEELLQKVTKEAWKEIDYFRNHRGEYVHPASFAWKRVEKAWRD